MMEALSPANIGLLLFGIFFVLLLIGSPIMVALGVATMACFIVLDIDLSLMIERAFASLTAFPLMALPAFVLAGSLMEAAGVSRRLVHVAENIVGPTPGGLAISTTLSCVFFGAISGSGPATTAAVGMLMIPAMAKRGYNIGYAAAATATAIGVMSVMVPTDVPMESDTKQLTTNSTATEYFDGMIDSRKYATLSALLRPTTPTNIPAAMNMSIMVTMFLSPMPLPISSSFSSKLRARF